MAYRKVCRFCEKSVAKIDYKDAKVLERYLTDRGKILPRRATGNCPRTQRRPGPLPGAGAVHSRLLRLNGRTPEPGNGRIR